MRSSTIKKRSVIVAGHKTSVSLEEEFWKAFKQIAENRGVTATDLLSEVDKARNHENLSSALRLFVLSYFRDQVIGPE